MLLINPACRCCSIIRLDVQYVPTENARLVVAGCQDGSVIVSHTPLSTSCDALLIC